MAASIRWPDDDGAWLVTAHWAKVDGRAVIVGLDVRSFTDVEHPGAVYPSGEVEPGWTERRPVGDQLSEVTQRVLRGIQISEIRERTREILIRSSEHVLFGMPAEVAAEHGGWAAERLMRLTAKGQPRKRRPKANEDLLRHVAALYEHAVAHGDTAPAKYVEEQLRAAGEPRLSTNGGRVLVRQWIRRARERGYLTVRPPRGEGARW